jgi:AcrR family transcriptional regulator
MTGQRSIDGEQAGSAFRRGRLAATPAARSRRQVVRARTAAAIKEAARELLSVGGEPALTLRGVARKVGITATAIYRYYPSRDSLADALRADLCAELISFVESARDGLAEDDPAARMGRITLAFREWTLDQRAEYKLLFFPGSAEPLASVSDQEFDPGYQLGVLFYDECAEIWLRHKAGSRVKAPPDEGFDLYLRPWLRERYPGLPASVIFASLLTWLKLCGLILMEAAGVTRAQAGGRRLLETELADHVGRLTA